MVILNFMGATLTLSLFLKSWKQKRGLKGAKYHNLSEVRRLESGKVGFKLRSFKSQSRAKKPCWEYGAHSLQLRNSTVM